MVSPALRATNGVARSSQAGCSALTRRGHRKLLIPGQRERLDFTSVRLTSRRLGAGSRLAVLLNVIKAPSLQINFGTGKDVSDETISDAKVPLTIQWFADTYIELPVRR